MNSHSLYAPGAVGISTASERVRQRHGGAPGGVGASCPDQRCNYLGRFNDASRKMDEKGTDQPTNQTEGGLQHVVGSWEKPGIGAVEMV